MRWSCVCDVCSGQHTEDVGDGGHEGEAGEAEDGDAAAAETVRTRAHDRPTQADSIGTSSALSHQRVHKHDCFVRTPQTKLPLSNLRSALLLCTIWTMQVQQVISD